MALRVKWQNAQAVLQFGEMSMPTEEIWPVEEWVAVARMFHRDWLEHGNETARKARDTAMPVPAHRPGMEGEQPTVQQEERQSPRRRPLSLEVPEYLARELKVKAATEVVTVRDEIQNMRPETCPPMPNTKSNVPPRRIKNRPKSSPPSNLRLAQTSLPEGHLSPRLVVGSGRAVENAVNAEPGRARISLSAPNQHLEDIRGDAANKHWLWTTRRSCVVTIEGSR